MQIEIAVKVDGKVVKTHAAEVSGTLEEMEETIHALGKRVANQTLQASVDAAQTPRPLFQKPAANSATKGTSGAR
jgi:hypothetical protein